LFADRHQNDGWSGESRRFGEGVAILVGDLAFVYADMLVDGAPQPAMAIWHELRIELNVGQYLDILGTASGERRLHRAEQISRFKSAKYTVERPLQMGALLAAPERAAELLPVLSRYGLALGDAFQLRDDVLGSFGDDRVTGKPVGDDLIEGKPTPLLALATAAATAAQRDILASVGRSVGPAGIADIQQVLVDTGALACVEAKITALTDEAIAVIRTAPLLPHARQALTELAYFVARRNT
jgi:geranylgeranyl diphosphate synthase type I